MIKRYGSWKYIAKETEQLVVGSLTHVCYQSLRARKVIIHEPYQILWRQYNALDTYHQDQRNPRDCRTHIKVLLDFLGSCDMPNVPELLKLCNARNTIRSISYASLWFLFSPETVIVTQNSSLSHAKASLVEEVEPPKRTIDRKGQSVYENFKLRCHEVGYDGRVFGFRSSLNTLKPFSGDVPLSKLDLIPLELLAKFEEKRGYLVSRGQRFWDLGGQHMKEFVNTTLLEQSLVVSSTLLHSDILEDTRCLESHR